MLRTVQVGVSSSDMGTPDLSRRYAGEGFDDARLDTLFLVMPVAWRGTLVQYAGRLHRLHPGELRLVEAAALEADIRVRRAA